MTLNIVYILFFWILYQVKILFLSHFF